MIEVTRAFTGYPDGKKRSFAAGERPDGIPSDYAELLVKKGLAKRVKATKGNSDEAE